jgi:circadian clock protein KaiB
MSPPVPVVSADVELRPETGRLVLQLYVSGATAGSLRAIANITAIGEDSMRGQYDLEVIDACQQSDLTCSRLIVVLPTLVRQLPLPARRIVGDLSNLDYVLRGLGLDGADTDEIEPRTNDPDVR